MLIFLSNDYSLKPDPISDKTSHSHWEPFNLLNLATLLITEK